jgi:hypothetical protein
MNLHGLIFQLAHRYKQKVSNKEVDNIVNYLNDIITHDYSHFLEIHVRQAISRARRFDSDEFISQLSVYNPQKESDNIFWRELEIKMSEFADSGDFFALGSVFYKILVQKGFINLTEDQKADYLKKAQNIKRAGEFGYTNTQQDVANKLAIKDFFILCRQKAWGIQELLRMDYEMK